MYAASSACDIASTYAALSTGAFYEANPNTAALLGNPLLLALREVLVILLLALLAYALRRVAGKLGLPPSASNAPVAAASAVRAAAALHNAVLLALHAKTTFSRVGGEKQTPRRAERLPASRPLLDSRTPQSLVPHRDREASGPRQSQRVEDQ